MRLGMHCSKLSVLHCIKCYNVTDVGSGGQVTQAGVYCSAATHSHHQGRPGQPYTAGYAQTLPASSQYRQQPQSQTGSPQVTMVNGQIDCTDDQRYASRFHLRGRVGRFKSMRYKSLI